VIEGTAPVAGPQLRLIQGGAAVARPPAPAGHVDEEFPASPPPDVLAELDRAAQVMHELARRNVNLHFEVDSQSKEVRVQVLGEGRLVREIPATRLLDVLSGGADRGVAVRAVG